MSDGAPASADRGFERRALGLLADLSQSLAVTPDVERTLAKAVRRIAECMEAEAASVFMLDDSGAFLECRACAGPVDVRGLRLPLGTGIVGRTFGANECQMVRDVRADPDFAGKVDAGTGFATRSILCAPLATTRGPIGVIEVMNKRGGALFDESDRDMLRVLAAPCALAISNAGLLSELMEQNRIRRELQLARRMQRSLLPKRRKGDYPVVGINRPAREVSGDFYDHFELPDGRIAFTVGDVAGKGLDASLLMVRTASLLRWAGKDAAPPDRWLARVNDELAETVAGGMFVCAVVGYFDPATREACWANAGFPPAFIHRRSGAFESVDADGPPLAVLPGVPYAVQQARLDDASLYFFSDGVTDVRDGDRAPLGLEGARGLIARFSDSPPSARLRGIVSELKRMRLADDTTLLLVEGRT